MSSSLLWGRLFPSLDSYRSTYLLLFSTSLDESCWSWVLRIDAETNVRPLSYASEQATLVVKTELIIASRSLNTAVALYLRSENDRQRYLNDCYSYHYYNY